MKIDYRIGDLVYVPQNVAVFNFLRTKFFYTDKPTTAIITDIDNEMYNTVSVFINGFEMRVSRGDIFPMEKKINVDKVHTNK